MRRTLILMLALALASACGGESNPSDAAVASAKAACASVDGLQPARSGAEAQTDLAALREGVLAADEALTAARVALEEAKAAAQSARDERRDATDAVEATRSFPWPRTDEQLREIEKAEETSKQTRAAALAAEAAEVEAQRSLDDAQAAVEEAQAAAKELPEDEAAAADAAADVAAIYGGAADTAAKAAVSEAQWNDLLEALSGLETYWSRLPDGVPSEDEVQRALAHEERVRVACRRAQANP